MFWQISSHDNINHKPGGGNAVIHDKAIKWTASPKVNSLENQGYKPKGGNVEIETYPVKWKSGSKVASFENISHHPVGNKYTLHCKQCFTSICMCMTFLNLAQANMHMQRYNFKKHKLSCLYRLCIKFDAFFL